MPTIRCGARPPFLHAFRKLPGIALREYIDTLGLQRFRLECKKPVRITWSFIVRTVGERLGSGTAVIVHTIVG